VFSRSMEQGVLSGSPSFYMQPDKTPPNLHEM
jgi:hypothetical protein